MSTSDNVIELKNFIKKRETKKKNNLNNEQAPVVGISGLRQCIIDEEKRKVKRTILTEFIGASVILPGSGLVRVSLNDIAKGGLSFDVQKKYGTFSKGDQVALRVYLNHTTYFPISIEVTHVNYEKKTASHRHGAKFLEESMNHESVHHFIRFMETVSTSLRADLGDILLTK